MNIYLEHKDKQIGGSGMISDGYRGYVLDKKLHVRSPIIINWLKRKINNIVPPHKYMESVGKSEFVEFEYNYPNIIIENMISSYLNTSFNIYDSDSFVRNYIANIRIIRSNKIVLWEGIQEKEQKATEKDLLEAKKYLKENSSIVKKLDSNAGFVTIDLLLDLIDYLKNTAENEDIREAQDILKHMLSLQSSYINLSEIRLAFLDAKDSEIINFTN